MKLSAMVVRALANAWQAILRERAAARAQRNLHALSDHMLRDIGLDRASIDDLRE